MATVRIYKVAELLNLSSQDVMSLLKKDHGIEVKSASSTIEEVVARQFVERLARQRNISLPTGDIFAEGPPVKGKKPAPAKKAPEPPKPTAPAAEAAAESAVDVAVEPVTAPAPDASAEPAGEPVAEAKAE